MKKQSIVFFIFFIFVLQSVQLIYFVHKDNSNPEWDQSWHLMISLHKYYKFKGIDTTKFESAYPIFNWALNYYPPFFHYTTVPFFMMFGPSYDSGMLTNLFYLGVLVLSCFFIGKKLSNNKTGLILAFIVSTIPLYNELMRDYLLDYPLVSMIALGYMFLLYSDNFNNKKFSILFGLTFGCGLLIKWSYFVYFIIPLLKIKNPKNYILPFSIAFLVALPFYIKFNFLQLLANLSSQGNPEFYTFSGITYYLFAIINGFSFVYFVLFLYSLKNKKTKPVLGNVFFICGLFTLISNKDPRYIAPVFIFMSMVIACNKFIRKHLLVFIMLFAAFNLAYNSSMIDYTFSIGKTELINTQSNYPFMSSVNLNSIFPYMTKTNYTVCVVAEHNDINDVSIPYYAMKGNYPVTYMMGNGCNPLYFDYTVLGPIKNTWRQNNFLKSKQILQQNLNKFKMVYSTDTVQVYEKIE